MKKIEEALKEYGFIADGDEAYINHRDIVQDAIAELDELKQNLRDMLDMYSFCPVCGREYRYSHVSDCWLGNMLKGAK